MIELCALASGSNGNCYYVGNEKEAVLVDAGIAARRIMDRMIERRLDPLKIKAVFLTHEHSDHIRGARVLSKKLKIPVYLTSKTYTAIYARQRPALSRFFKPGDIIGTGAFIVHPFLKSHDAAEPCSFRIEYEGMNIGIMTDIGFPCDSVRSHLNKCDALFLESNYDEKMLWEGNYPWPLKKRIASDQGHLSNDQAAKLIKDHCGKNLKIIFLSHLSAENNTPGKVADCFSALSGDIRMQLTSRHAASEVVTLTNGSLKAPEYQGSLNLWPDEQTG